MKALSLMQPWATLVAIGAKKFETRSWATSYRGPLAIHACKGFPQWVQALVDKEPFNTALNGVVLPRGAVIATCRLVRCVSTFSLIGKLSEQEQAFGFFMLGKFAWELAGVVQIEPVPATGSLGLWTW